MSETVKKSDPKKPASSSPLTLEQATPLTLEQAIKNGDAVLKSSVDAMIAEEMKKNMGKLKDAMRTEITKELALEKVIGSKMGVDSYLNASGLGDRDFVVRLMAMNITPKMATYLRDEHIRLTDAQLWDYIRETMHKEHMSNKIRNVSTIGS